MRSIAVLALSGLMIAGCDSYSNVSGTGVVDALSSIDFIGYVLQDRDSGQTYDVSHHVDATKVGAIVEYEGLIDRSQPELAEVPPKIQLKRFEIIAFEN